MPQITCPWTWKETNLISALTNKKKLLQKYIRNMLRYYIRCCFRVRSASEEGQLYLGLNRYRLHLSSFVDSNFFLIWTNKESIIFSYGKINMFLLSRHFLYKETTISMCTFSPVWGFLAFVNVMKIGKLKKWKYFNQIELCSCSPLFFRFPI